MGLLFFFGFQCLLIVAHVAFIKKPAERRRVIDDWIKHPVRNAFALLWVGSILVFMWGVLSRNRLSWTVDTPWGRMHSTGLAGVLSVAGLAVLFVASAYDNHRERKRMRREIALLEGHAKAGRESPSLKSKPGLHD